MTNLDVHEIAKFNDLSASWWDPNGPFKPLHQLNPLRLDYIKTRSGGELAGKTIIDVGCGGGILSESLAEQGAKVTGIDLAKEALECASLHSLESQVRVDYQLIAVDDYAQEYPQHFDIVCCLEMLEHVPDPQAIINACAKLVKPGGHLFFSTINRNLSAYLMAILGAEYALKMLPIGTHDYARFLKPAELAHCVRKAQLQLQNITGIDYNPISRQFYCRANHCRVNYIIHCQSEP